MKKRVALLLAALMSLSMLSVNVFAATNNYVDNRVTVPDASAIVEHGLNFTATTYLRSAGNLTGDPDWYVDGTDLVVPLQRDVITGYQFKLTLSNAKWFFRNNVGDANNVVSTEDFPLAAEPGNPESTYDKAKGQLNSRYVYERTTPGGITTISGVPYSEALYTLEVSRLNDNVATVTVKGNYPADYPPQQNWVFRIPLVTYIGDSNVEATVSVDPGNTSTVTQQKVIFANTAEGKTNSTAKDVTVARDVFELDTFVVSELRVGSIRDGEIIKLSLPYGYRFSDNLADIRVGVESGLAWGDGSTGYGNPVRTLTSLPDDDYFLWFYEGYEYNDKLSQSAYSSTDNTELWIYLGQITESTQLRGSIYIDNLEIWADDDAAMPASGKELEIKIHVDGEDNITEQDVLVAKRVDWLLGLKTLTTVPTLVSGRYIGPSWDGLDADDNTHKTARVQLYESAANSWWGARTTVLVLPATDNNTVKGAKFRKVEVDDQDNVNTNMEGYRATSALYSSTNNPQYPGYSVPTDDGVYLNDGEKHGAITVNDNKITISNVSLDTAEKSWINFDLWVSIELGYGKQSGDLTLSIDPSSTSVTGAAADALPSVVIAHVVDPITISANVSDVKIGYQYQTTSDIQIKENGAGYLLRDKTVRVSITDLISSDLYFTNETKIQVTAGDLKIDNIYATGQGGFTSQSNSWLELTTGTGTLAFDIEKASTVASTITISNVAVKLDRTVPVTNKSAYQVVVWGTAVAENYGLIDDRGRTWKADFNTAGEFLPYINVISSPDDASSILTQEVRVTIGESYYVVNG
ncbi:MAG: hypothetical protein LBS84_10505, partial [Clostridiales bacterium]|nr:hypothetical protein [Clostridiales bacterium]